MAIAVLERTPELPAVEPGVRALVAEAGECVTRAGLTSFESLDDRALGEAVAELTRLESQGAALRLALSAEADRRRVADKTADTGTDAWLARLTGSTREQMAGGLWLAGLLRDKYTATREAFAAGELRVDQVRVVVRAAEQAPAEATPAQVSEAEAWLIGKATGAGNRSGRPMDARRLRQAARRMFSLIDLGLAHRHEAILLGRERRTAEAETFFSLTDNGDGTFSGRFRIPELHGHLLTQAIDRLTAPRRLGRDRAGALVVDESTPGGGSGVSIFETRGAALCELIEHLPTLGHGGNACDVLVTIDLDVLLTGLGAARLDTGVAITAGEAHRLACNAGIVPAVLGGDSVALDLGRSRRLHSRSQRRALSLRHDSCAVAGCERPFAWCEIHHHRLAWGAGGRTDLNNGLPLCGHHHRRAHDTRFDLRRRADGEWAFHPRR